MRERISIPRVQHGSSVSTGVRSAASHRKDTPVLPFERCEMLALDLLVQKQRRRHLQASARLASSMPVATLRESSQRPRYSYRAQRWSLQSSLDPAFDSGSLRLAPSSKPSKLGSSGSIVACTRRTLSPVALSLRASAHPSRNDLPNPACRVSGLCEYYGCAMVNLSRKARARPEALQCVWWMRRGSSFVAISTRPSGSWQRLVRAAPVPHNAGSSYARCAAGVISKISSLRVKLLAG